MEKERKIKIIAIVVLFIGITTLSIGFALFSAQLRIQSKATVTPDADSFKVVLSKEKTKETVGTIAPTGNGDEATIDNTGDPTISNLKAKFTKPGQRVEYEFYAVNTGELTAYLNKIEYANVASSTANKVCTAGEDTTDAYVQSACDSIRVTVKVGEDDKACQTSTYATHSLAKNVGEKVVVAIEYDKTGAVADGPFEVEFGDITLNYSTTDSETKNVPECEEFNTIAVNTNFEDLDSDGNYSLGDKVTLGTESFYVMSTDEATNTVTMLAEWNLNVGNNTVEGTAGMQNEACKSWFNELSERNCTITFSSTNYWISTTTEYPSWVYDNNDVIRPIVENYVNEFRKLGFSSVTGRLIKYEELVTLGCVFDGNCNSAPLWVYNTTYWTGSAGNSTQLCHVYANGSFNDGRNYTDSSYVGLRPVITINVSDL